MFLLNNIQNSFDHIIGVSSFGVRLFNLIYFSCFNDLRVLLTSFIAISLTVLVEVSQTVCNM